MILYTNDIGTEADIVHDNDNNDCSSSVRLIMKSIMNINIKR